MVVSIPVSYDLTNIIVNSSDKRCVCVAIISIVFAG